MDSAARKAIEKEMNKEQRRVERLERDLVRARETVRKLRAELDQEG